MGYEKWTEQDEKNRTSFKVWEKGVYDFTTLEEVSFGTKTYYAKETLSKAGNPMWVIPVKIFAKDGSDFTIHLIDYIPTTGEMRFKHAHLADATGNGDKYDSGKLTLQDVLFKSGRLELDIQKGSSKPDGGTYPDKNVIRDYVKKESSGSKKDELDDDIPF